MIDNTTKVHKLHLENVSFSCTVEQEALCARLYSPPQVAHILRNVSLEAVSGEVHAIVGSSGILSVYIASNTIWFGSGKKLLLDVIARTASGDITGAVQLNKYTVTRSRFLKYCSYVPARREYPGFMTLNSLLYYTAALTFGKFKANDIKTRLHYLMQTFDLLCYGHKKLGNLSKSARRRAAVAIALIKDPVLLLLENPLRELEPIACYQLINCLRSYAIEQNRIVLITINEPRTDICQSISKITVLFQGRVMYSGHIRNLRTFMHDAGLRCPENENPVMYFSLLIVPYSVTKATLNRETHETYTRTYDQALRLVFFFKNHCAPAVPARSRHNNAHTGGTVALCFLPRPSSLRKFSVLVQRSLTIIGSNTFSFLLRLVIIPIVMSSLPYLGPDLQSGLWTAPYASTRILELALFLLYFSTSCLTTLCYGKFCSINAIETSDGLYGGLLCPLVFIFVLLVTDLTTVSLSTAAFLWLSNVTVVETIIRVAPVFACIFLIAEFVSVSAMLYIEDALTCCISSISILLLWMMFGGGLLRSLATYPFYLVTYFSYINPIRYANYILSLEITSMVPINGCARAEKGDIDTTPLEKFCRWRNSSKYMQEMYPDSIQPRDYWSNIAALAAIVFVLFLFMLFLHSISQSKRSEDRIKTSN